MNLNSIASDLGRLLFLGLCFSPLATIRAGEPPKWLRKIEGQPVASTAPDVPAEVLLNETVLTVDEWGRATTEHRYAIKILTRAGLSEAHAFVAYLDKNDKVSAADAWLLRNGTVAKAESDNKWFDVSAADGEGAIYSETRIKEISFRDDTVPGDIFACETKVEGPMLFTQDFYTWDNPLPTAVDRYVVKVPPGWTVTPILSGAISPAASVSADNRSWGWELRDRPYRPHEPWTDPHSMVEAQVMVNLVSPGSPKPGVRKIFRTWTEVSEWQATLTSGQCDNDPAMSAKARQLAADGADAIAKIRALGGYVQKLRYVAINRNLARGMGYRPRKASEVFAKGFGDCKDKANLLRAMLREVGITSYPVVALAGNERVVEQRWPSPSQFNHQILAIQVDNKVDLPTVVQTHLWGSLLFFDPTDPETVVGDLPWHLQGSNVLVLAPGSDELIRLPNLPVDRRWLAERRVKLLLTADGAVSGECHFIGFAQNGAQMRHHVHAMSAKDLHDWATARINAAVRGASAKAVACEDDIITGRFGVTFNFAAPSFTQMMPGGLAVVRLDVLDRGTLPTFAENSRRTAAEIRPLIQDDEVTLALPSGFAVEELPTKTVLNSAYGSYENSYDAKEGTVVFHRTLKLNPLVVQASDYPKLRQFLANASKADREAVVLRIAK